MNVAALFVETGGNYFGLPNVDPWDKTRDARAYPGMLPVVAHPPCERWGRMAKGGPSAPNTREIGDDDGCFAAALEAVRKWGGVLEHPADSHAWQWFGIDPPPRYGGWLQVNPIGFTCCVYQGHYGHFAGKPSWLYANIGDRPPDLIWGKCEQRLHPVALERHGYEKARRIGMMAMVGGKNKTKIRNATPVEFRDLLISIASKTTFRGGQR